MLKLHHHAFTYKEAGVIDGSMDDGSSPSVPTQPFYDLITKNASFCFEQKHITRFREDFQKLIWNLYELPKNQPNKGSISKPMAVDLSPDDDSLLHDDDGDDEEDSFLDIGVLEHDELEECPTEEPSGAFAQLAQEAKEEVDQAVDPRNMDSSKCK